MRLQWEAMQAGYPGFTLQLDATVETERLGVFGESGAGKTSLLDVLCGLLKPQAGRVLLNGDVLSDAATGTFLPPAKRRMGYVAQEGALFPHLSARANLLYASRGRVADEALFTKVLEVLKLEPLVGRRPGELSGGERRRVAIGRALLGAPRVLLFDEPLSGLHHALRDEAMTLFERIHAQFRIPFVVVSHEPEEIARLCQHVVVLDKGRLQRQGAPEELFERAEVPVLRLKSVCSESSCSPGRDG